MKVQLLSLFAVLVWLEMAFAVPLQSSPSGNIQNITPQRGLLRRSFIACQPTFDDVLLYTRKVESRALNYNNEHIEVVIPERGVGTAKIHCIRAIDTSIYGQGGTVTIKQGGLNETFVVLEITAQVGHGFFFNIEVYGS